MDFKKSKINVCQKNCLVKTMFFWGVVWSVLDGGILGLGSAKVFSAQLWLEHLVGTSSASACASLALVTYYRSLFKLKYGLLKSLT